jgi:hypothetical protein
MVTGLTRESSCRAQETVNRVLDKVIDLSTLVPSFAFTGIDGTFYQVGPNSNILPTRVEGAGTRYIFEQSAFSATLTQEERGLWELNLLPKVQLKSEGVVFPWWGDRLNLKLAGSDERIYYPFIGGVSEKQGLRTHPNWWGVAYPGGVFAPLIIHATNSQAMLVAAANWPPRRVTPLYAHRAQLIFATDLKVNTATSFRIFFKRFELNDAGNTGSWQRALLFYRRWLMSKLKVAPSSEWLQQSEGFLNYGLMNSYEFKASQLEAALASVKGVTDWALLWGQMSNFAGDASIAVPKLLAGEEVGCCLPEIKLHSRYLGIPEIAGRWRSQGGHLGYYSRLRPDSTGAYMGSKAGVDFITHWFSFNRTQLNADSFYLDEYGRTNYGEVTPDLKPYTDPFFNGVIPKDTLIEGFVDIYPRPALLSGGLRSNPPMDPSVLLSTDFEKGGAAADSAGQRVPSYRMARLLMGNRPGFAGYANGDYAMYSSQFAASPSFAERQVFLAGLKFDIGYSAENGYGPTAVIREVAQLRRDFRWWDRNPVYLDTIGVGNLPSGISVRRFVDCAQKTLFTIDNPARKVGMSFTFYGRSISIPAARLSIVELADDGE